MYGGGGGVIFTGMGGGGGGEIFIGMGGGDGGEKFIWMGGGSGGVKSIGIGGNGGGGSGSTGEDIAGGGELRGELVTAIGVGGVSGVPGGEDAGRVVTGVEKVWRAGGGDCCGDAT